MKGLKRRSEQGREVCCSLKGGETWDSVMVAYLKIILIFYAKPYYYGQGVFIGSCANAVSGG